ncbi:tripeptidyl peptidase a [Trichoderma cornu-damae]|uniref:tripeptidyl-peptidase II n=1 Tax=Trichoderma cornu-damae TaxID=654480 RepID=A0A9P8TX44_9HYPO|nr:tripeptidyl peptidase a [Trichoderma cornu-damae]
MQASAAVLLESINRLPPGWKAAVTPSPSSHIVLQVALAQQNIDQLESRLAAVSTPNSSTYGKYLDLDEINEIFAPSNDSKTAVESWLQSHGVTKYTNQGSSIWFQTNVSTANTMLSTNFKTYSDPTGARKLRTTKYSIPESLVGHVDLIAPTTYFGTSKAMRARRSRSVASAIEPKSLAARQEPSNCKGTLVFDGRTFNIFQPNCLRTEYNVDGYTPSAKSGSRIGFGSFLNQSASFSDLALFEKHFNLPSQNFSVVLINGGTDLPQPPSNDNDGEANLDVQNILSIAHPLPITEFITAGSPPYFPDPVEPAGTPDENEPYLQFYEYLLSKTNAELPQVITNSYGDEEQTVPQAYAVRVCNLIGLMGLRGISILESSGDEGVGASCVATNGTTPQFNPIFPATCPYVTSVGGTISFNPEVAWDGSSGGFSYYFSRPWYQEEAVGTYLTKYVSDETKKYYGPYVDFSGRGFPDIAAHSVSPDGGTSAASPVVASIIALLNDARLRVGKPTLGFLNPLIYQYAYRGFTDITSGQSDGCNGNDTQTGGPIPGS